MHNAGGETEFVLQRTVDFGLGVSCRFYWFDYVNKCERATGGTHESHTKVWLIAKQFSNLGEKEKSNLAVVFLAEPTPSKPSYICIKTCWYAN